MVHRAEVSAERYFPRVICAHVTEAQYRFSDVMAQVECKWYFATKARCVLHKTEAYLPLKMECPTGI